MLLARPVGTQPAKRKHEVPVRTWARKRKNMWEREISQKFREICAEEARNFETKLPPSSRETLVKA